LVTEIQNDLKIKEEKPKLKIKARVKILSIGEKINAGSKTFPKRIVKKNVPKSSLRK